MHQDLSTLPGRGPLVAACSECGTPFRLFPSQSKAACSDTCGRVRRSRLARERNSRPCVICRTMFYDAPSSFDKEGRKTCSLTCRGLWQRGKTLTRVTDAATRFAAKIIVQDGCWGWAASTDSDGYGKFYDGTRLIRASRFAWKQATGETLTTDDHIGHICDNPPCTRNDDEGWYEVRGVLLPRRGHLFKGTSGDNTRDMHQKGRNVPVCLTGESNPRSKLTEADIDLIRTASAEGTHENALAAQFGVTPQMIRLIVARKNWKHVP
jgi:hypothetical protein